MITSVWSRTRPREKQARKVSAGRLPVTNLANFPEARFWIVSALADNGTVSSDLKLLTDKMG